VRSKSGHVSFGLSLLQLKEDILLFLRDFELQKNDGGKNTTSMVKTFIWKNQNGGKIQYDGYFAKILKKILLQ
jgi:hypothetical protein